MRQWLVQLADRTGLKTDVAWRRDVLRCFAIAALFHAVAAWFSHGYLHLDEHFQIIEFANVKLQRVSPELLTWEVAEKARPWLQPAMTYLVFKAMQLLGSDNPITWMRGIRFFSGFFALGGALAFVLANYRSISSGRRRRGMLYLSTFFCVFPWLHVRTSSENYSATAMLLAISTLLLAKKDGNGAALAPTKNWDQSLLFLSGLSCGLAFNFRYQIGFMILGFAAWCIIQARLSFKNAAVVFCGFLLANAFAILVDHWGWGDWSYAPWNYFHTQVIQGIANKFGKSPWWYFTALLWKEFPQPFGAFMLIGLGWGILSQPKHLAAFCAIPFLLMHTAFGHKEARFLIPVLYLLPVLVAVIAKPRVFQRLPRWVLVGLIALNGIYLVRDIVKPLDGDIPYLYEVSEAAPLASVLLWEGHNPFSYYPLTMYFYQPRGLQVLERTSILPKDSPYFLYRRISMLAKEGLPPECIEKDHSSLLLKNLLKPWEDQSAVNDLLKKNELRGIYLCGASSQLH